MNALPENISRCQNSYFFFFLCCVHFIIYQEKIERLRFERVKIDSQEEKQNIFKNKAFSKTKHFQKQRSILKNKNEREEVDG